MIPEADVGPAIAGKPVMTARASPNDARRFLNFRMIHPLMSHSDAQLLFLIFEIFLHRSACRSALVTSS
jgi:hypothetical protein